MTVRLNGNNQQDSVDALLAGTDSRYVGYARQALGPTFMQMPDPVKAMLDAAAEREAAARRAAAFAASLKITAPQPPAVFTNTSTLAGIDAASNKGATFGMFPNTPESQVPGGLAADMGTPPMSVPSPTAVAQQGPQYGQTYDDMMKGMYTAESPFSMVKSLMNAGLLNKDSIDIAMQGDFANPGGGDFGPQGAQGAQGHPLDPSQVDRVLARQRPDGGYPEGMYDPTTVQEALGNLDSAYARVQRQAYGDPEPIDGKPFFETSYQKYYGIDIDRQAMGYVAFHRPDDLPKNPTPAQKMKYIADLQNMFVAPRYQVGVSADHLMGLDRQGTIQLQKKLRAAGLYKSTDMPIPGILKMEDIVAYEAALGMANQAGLTIDDTLALVAKNRASVLAQQKAAGGGGGGGGAPTNWTQTNINYATTSLADGRALLARVLSQALGRAPSPQELQDYLSRLNAAEAKSPTKTITNYVKSGDDTTATQRTNPSNVDPESMARQFAAEINGGTEMFDVQANAYLDRLMSMLMGAQNV
jgi:hypothetical protein